MIIEKKISFNMNKIDEVILDLANEINKGYTVYMIDQQPISISWRTIDTEPCCTVTLRKKELTKI